MNGFSGLATTWVKTMNNLDLNASDPWLQSSWWGLRHEYLMALGISSSWRKQGGEKQRKWSEQARFSGGESHCNPFEGNWLMVITYGNLIGSGSCSGHSEVKGILVWKDQSIWQKHHHNILRNNRKIEMIKFLYLSSCIPQSKLSTH